MSDSYSNSIFQLEQKMSVRFSGFTPLTLYINKKQYHTKELDEDGLNQVVAEVNEEPLFGELTENLSGLAAITLEDVKSSINFLQGKPKRQISAEGFERVEYVIPKVDPPLANSKVEEILETIWSPTEPIEIDGRPAQTVLTWMVTRPDGGLWGAFNNGQFVAELQHCQNYAYCGGTWQGMLTVLEKGITDTKLDPEVDFTPYFDRIMEKVPFKNNLRVNDAPWTLRGSFMSKFMAIERNPKAKAGLPFPPDRLADDAAVAAAYIDASALYEMFESGKTAEEVYNFCLSVRPDLLCTRIANKFDTYEIKNLKTKTRVYHKYPLAIRMLTQAWHQPMKDDVLATDDPDYKVQSMLGHSWFHGGAEKLHNYIMNAPEGKLCTLFYSDDSGVFVRQGDVVKWASNDFSHMDGSIRAAHVDLNMKRDLLRVAAHGGLMHHRELARFTNMIAYDHLVLGPRSTVWLKQAMNSSGNVLTTKINNVTSALASCVAEDLWHEGGYDFDTFEDFLEVLPARLREDVGMVSKLNRDSRVFLKKLHPGSVMALDFLGQRLACVQSQGRDVIVPFPPKRKVVMSYVFAPRMKDGDVIHDLRIARCIGISASGGFYYEDIMKVSDSTYRGALKAKQSDENLSVEAKKFDLEKVINTHGMYAEALHPLEKEIFSSHDFSSGPPEREWYIELFAAEPQYKPKIINPPRNPNAPHRRERVNRADILKGANKTVSIRPGGKPINARAALLKTKEAELHAGDKKKFEEARLKAQKSASQLAAPLPGLTAVKSKADRKAEKLARVEKNKSKAGTILWVKTRDVSSIEKRAAQDRIVLPVRENKPHVYPGLSTDGKPVFLRPHILKNLPRPLENLAQVVNLAMPTVSQEYVTDEIRRLIQTGEIIQDERGVVRHPPAPALVVSVPQEEKLPPVLASSVKLVDGKVTSSPDVPVAVEQRVGGPINKPTSTAPQQEKKYNAEEDGVDLDEMMLALYLHIVEDGPLSIRQVMQLFPKKYPKVVRTVSKLPTDDAFVRFDSNTKKFIAKD